jgi:tetratricopeptide (TPR) repeat protein
VLELGFAADAGDPVFRNPLLEDYTSRGEWANALSLLQRALESKPGDRAIVRQLIDTQHRSGDDRAALQTLDTALAAEPQDVELLGVRAGLREGLGDEDGAVADLERARAIHADFSDPLLELLQRIADRSAPDNDSHAIRFVDLLLETGQTGRARSELERLLARTPNHKEALRRIATLASSEGDWELATSAYHELFPLLDGTDELRSVALALAATCELAGRVADARSPLERALELSPDDPVIEDKLEQVYQSNADFSGLARLITKRAERASEPGERTRMLVRAARVLFEQADDVHRALSILEQIRADAPHDLEANLLWARAQRKLGHAARVLEPLRETLNANRGKRTPLVASAQLEIAHAHLAGDDLFEALDALKAGFNLDRKNVELALLLGLVALDLDDEKTAERALLSVISQPAQGAEAIATAEMRATAFFQLAALAYAKGDLARARRMAGKATSEDASHEGARALLEVLAPRAVATG